MEKPIQVESKMPEYKFYTIKFNKKIIFIASEKQPIVEEVSINYQECKDFERIMIDECSVISDREWQDIKKMLAKKNK